MFAPLAEEEEHEVADKGDWFAPVSSDGNGIIDGSETDIGMLGSFLE